MLSQDDRMALESLTKHPGFEVLKRIEEEESISLGKVLQVADLDDPVALALLKKNQIYAKARQDFLLNVEGHLQSIQSPEI